MARAGDGPGRDAQQHEHAGLGRGACPLGGGRFRGHRSGDDSAGARRLRRAACRTNSQPQAAPSGRAARARTTLPGCARPVHSSDEGDDGGHRGQRRSPRACAAARARGRSTPPARPAAPDSTARCTGRRPASAAAQIGTIARHADGRRARRGVDGCRTAGAPMVRRERGNKKWPRSRGRGDVRNSASGALTSRRGSALRREATGVAARASVGGVAGARPQLELGTRGDADRRSGGTGRRPARWPASTPASTGWRAPGRWSRRCPSARRSASGRTPGRRFPAPACASNTRTPSSTGAAPASRARLAAYLRLQHDRIDADAALPRQLQHVVETHQAGGVLAVRQHGNRLAADVALALRRRARTVSGRYRARCGARSPRGPRVRWMPCSSAARSAVSG